MSHITDSLKRIPIQASRAEVRDGYRKLRLIQSRCTHVWPRQPHSGRIGEGTINCELCLAEGHVSRDGTNFYVPSFEFEWDADDRFVYYVMPDGTLRPKLDKDPA